MKPFRFLLWLFALLCFWSCKKQAAEKQVMPIPNGDFESWNGFPVLLEWKTNSCPQCATPQEIYVVQKTTDAYSGQAAAKFVTGANRSQAYNKFVVPAHPSTLEGFVKSNITSGDTATISVDLYVGNTIIDGGNWFESVSSGGYRKIVVPISQLSAVADSAAVRITGGRKQGTAFYVDDLVFLR